MKEGIGSEIEKSKDLIVKIPMAESFDKYDLFNFIISFLYYDEKGNVINSKNIVMQDKVYDYLGPVMKNASKEMNKENLLRLYDQIDKREVALDIYEMFSNNGTNSTDGMFSRPAVTKWKLNFLDVAEAIEKVNVAKASIWILIQGMKQSGTVTQWNGNTSYEAPTYDKEHAKQIYMSRSFFVINK